LRGRLWIALAILTLALVLPSVAQAGEARADFRPWKAAMMVWFDEWSVHEYVIGIDWTQFDKPYLSAETPRGFNYTTNAWGEGARQFAQFITAVEGEKPNGQFDRPLRAIIEPYLGIDPEVPPSVMLRRP
jgi:hypothetical protein